MKIATTSAMTKVAPDSQPIKLPESMRIHPTGFRNSGLHWLQAEAEGQLGLNPEMDEHKLLSESEDFAT